jgi:predicted aconitase
MARLEGATSLVDVEMGHIDGCFYQGPGGLHFIERLRDMGAKVRIPTTMNAISVDRQRWRGQGVAEGLGAPSERLADAYVAMGVKPTYTCAPYLLDTAPRFGQQIAWAESNAVVFANSVLGARTMKYPDYLDILVAITGRAPDADCHRSESRKAAVRIDLPPLADVDDSFYALLGYHCGKLATNDIPLICGMEHLTVSRDHLKSFGAAFATTSAMPMFHMRGITPEAADAGDPSRSIQVTRHDLAETWRELNTATTPDVDLIALGNPHFSLDEIAELARLCSGKRKAAHTSLTVTCGRDVYSRAAAAGHVATVEAFGGKFLNDTCWCFIDEPVVPPEARNIATNSGKYAHYGAAALNRGFHFASLARCVEGARTGQIDSALPGWLTD